MSGSWSSSSAKSTAAGTTTTRQGSRFGYSTTCSFRIMPTLKPNATYRMDITHVSPNASTSLEVSIDYYGCTGTSNSTTAFQATGANTWETVGAITTDVGVTEPIITFTYLSGNIASTGGRWYVDAIRFVNLSDPCVNGLPELSTINGPLAAKQTFVDVPGVSTNAKAVKVYANGTLIGTKSGSVTSSVVRVTTSALVKDQIITATQTDAGGIDSCRPATGARVGGGSNTRIRVALSIRQSETLTGPIGANGGITNSILKFLGATNTYNGGFALAPMGNHIIYPDGCWQTVSFLRGPDPLNPTDKSYGWSGTDNKAELLGNYGILESIAFAIEDLNDTGPFNIYIDDLMNGPVLIQDFEKATNGQQAVQFNAPGFSSTTSPFLLAQSPGSISPNISMVTDSFSDSGNNSLQVSWQFKDTSAGNWLRLAAQGSQTPNPVLDLSLPITFRILITPVTQTNLSLQMIRQPASVSVLQGAKAQLQPNVCGTSPFSFQWYRNGSLIVGATNKVFTVDSAQLTDIGAYHVVVTNPAGAITSSVANLFVQSIAYAGSITQHWALGPTARPYLTNDGGQVCISYNPINKNLQVFSRSGGETVTILNPATLTETATLAIPSNSISGGYKRIGSIGVISDGSVYALNVTTNAEAEPLKIYKWWDESSQPFELWAGNPGGAGNTARWGDATDIRDVDFEGQMTPQILLGSVADNSVSVIMPVAPDSAPIVFVVSNAPPGAFAQCVAWGVGDTFWGKSYDGTLYYVSVNFVTKKAVLQKTFSQLPAAIALKTDPSAKILAAVSSGTPDTLSLYDISNPAAGLTLIDIVGFPTDNYNPNLVASIAFSPDRIFVLNNNNGLVAVSLLPILKGNLNGKTLQLIWSGTRVLQSAGEVTGPYKDVPSAVSPLNIPTATSTNRQFYRLKQ